MMTWDSARNGLRGVLCVGGFGLVGLLLADTGWRCWAVMGVFAVVASGLYAIGLFDGMDGGEGGE